MVRWQWVAYEDPMYVILTICRVDAYINQKLYLSKEDGGKWGISNLPEYFHELIGKALKCYKSEERMSLEDDNKRNLA